MDKTKMKNYSDIFTLQGKTIVITGGAGFLGQEYTKVFLSLGANVVVLDKEINGLESEVLHSDLCIEKLLALPIDITQSVEVKSACRQVVERFRNIDVLINNAANNPKMSEAEKVSRFETMSIDEWNSDIAVGLTGAFLCSQIFGTIMCNQKFGHIINISSDLGIISPDQRLYMIDEKSPEEQNTKPITYSVCKHGIIGLTRYLSTYWAQNGVRSNAVAFGGVHKNHSSEFVDRLSSLIPMARMANPDECVSTLIFLCSDASSYMNGSVIVVDGGRTVW
jgi:NAD(P)-dependent dehydrogenase (short-subunit alcohol dehydrogenase family)